MKALLAIVLVMVLIFPSVLAQVDSTALEGCEDVKWWQFFKNFKCKWGSDMFGWLDNLVASTIEPMLNFQVDKHGHKEFNELFTNLAYGGVTIMLLYAGWLYTSAGALGGHDIIEQHMKAKSQVVKAAIFGFAVFMVPFFLDILMKDVVGGVVTAILEIGGVSSLGFGLASGILLYFALTAPAFPVTWTIGIGLILIFLGALYARVIMLMFLFTIMPLILLAYLFTPTKNMGASLLKLTLINIAFPAIWATIIVLATSLGSDAGSVGGFVAGFALSMFSIIALPICGMIYFKYGAAGAVSMITATVAGAAGAGAYAIKTTKAVGKSQAYGKVAGGVNTGLRKVNMPENIRLPEAKDNTYERLKQVYGDDLQKMNSQELISNYNKVNKELQFQDNFKQKPLHHEVRSALDKSKTNVGLDSMYNRKAHDELKNEYGRTWGLKSETEQRTLIAHRKRSLLHKDDPTVPVTKGRKIDFAINSTDLTKYGLSSSATNKLHKIRSKGQDNDFLNFVVRRDQSIGQPIRAIHKAHNPKLSREDRSELIVMAHKKLHNVNSKKINKLVLEFEDFNTGKVPKKNRAKTVKRRGSKK